jgi:hypothetical protein
MSKSPYTTESVPNLAEGTISSAVGELGQAAVDEPGQAQDNSIFIENKNRRADDSFIDDLIAANNMKSYILSAGHDLEEQVIGDLNRLYSIFRSDIEARQGEIEDAHSSETV